MRALLLLLPLLAAPALALPPPLPVETPIPLGHGFFFDGGELVATVEFEVLQGGCNQLVYVRLMRHFLGFDKERFVWADLTCAPDGAGGQAWVMLGRDDLNNPTSNFKLVGGGVPGELVSLSGTYRDGYMSVYLA